MPQSADLSRRLESLIRTGTIAELDLAARPPVCRVTSGGLLTHWLQWVTLRAGQTRTWNPPTVGEQCVVLSASGETGVGIVLLGLSSDDIPAPSQSADETLTIYPDGARIRYDHVAGALEATGIRTALLQATNKVTVDCPATETTGDLTVGGNLLVKGTASVVQLLTYLAGMSGNGGSTGAPTKISGNIEHSGGELSSNGVVVDKHTHHDSLNGQTSVPQ